MQKRVTSFFRFRPFRLLFQEYSRYEKEQRREDHDCCGDRLMKGIQELNNEEDRCIRQQWQIGSTHLP